MIETREIPVIVDSRAASSLNPSSGHGDAAHRLGQQTRVGRVGHVSGHHRGVGAQPGGAQQLRLRSLTSNASLQPSTAAVPQRVVSFINVVGCGTVASNGIRQNRRQV